MIEFEYTEVYGWAAAIRGMRNPLDSWDKSDSWCGVHNQVVGEGDLALMKKLISAGTDHSKFMRFINVTCDVTAPLYWWKEFDTYKVGTVRNSCSTMHKIHAKEFTIDDFSHEYLNDGSLDILDRMIYHLNAYREEFLRGKDKYDWWQLIQLLPSSYNQKATVQLNYAVLRNMYHARKKHKLDEWKEFCKWVETLPYSGLITGSIER